VSGGGRRLWAVRMTALRQMRERGMTRRELADAAGMDDGSVLEVYLHTPQELERVCVALGWPAGHLLPLVRKARASPGSA
jgi:hypothetical protein